MKKCIAYLFGFLLGVLLMPGAVVALPFLFAHGFAKDPAKGVRHG